MCEKYEPIEYNDWGSKETKATIRKCVGCEYRTMMLQDKGENTKCRHCGSKLEIIAQGTFKAGD